MSVIAAFLLSKPGAILAWVSTLALGLMLAFMTWRFYDMQGQRDKYFNDIYDKKTGYVVKLERSQHNADQYRTSSESCNASVDDYKKKADDKTAEANRVAAENRRLRDQGNRRAGAIMALGARPGESDCEFADRISMEPVQ